MKYKLFFWLHFRQELEPSLVIVLTHQYSVTSISNITEFLTQLFLAWPQLFGIMMSTWQVWGPLLLLQVPFSAFYTIFCTSNRQCSRCCGFQFKLSLFHPLLGCHIYAIPPRRSLYQRQVRTTPWQTCCSTSTPMGWGRTSPWSSCPSSLTWWPMLSSTMGLRGTFDDSPRS